MTQEHADKSGFETRAIHAGYEPDPTTGAVIPPIFATSTYKQDGVGGLRGGYEYSRSANPTRTALEGALAAVEDGERGFAFASGLAAEDTLVRGICRPGDHVVFSFVPACGHCQSCADGHSNLCDNGAALLMGLQLDGTSRHHARDQDVHTMVCLGTFGRHTVVNEMSCVKIEDDIPLELACLVGCGVTTGWGSSVYAGEVRPG